GRAVARLRRVRLPGRVAAAGRRRPGLLLVAVERGPPETERPGLPDPGRPLGRRQDREGGRGHRRDRPRIPAALEGRTDPKSEGEDRGEMTPCPPPPWPGSPASPAAT